MLDVCRFASWSLLLNIFPMVSIGLIQTSSALAFLKGKIAPFLLLGEPKWHVLCWTVIMVTYAQIPAPPWKLLEQPWASHSISEWSFSVIEKQISILGEDGYTNKIIPTQLLFSCEYSHHQSVLFTTSSDIHIIRMFQSCNGKQKLFYLLSIEDWKT